MTDKEWAEIKTAEGLEYSRLRDSIIEREGSQLVTLPSPNPKPVPSMVDILKIHAAEPEKSKKFLGAFTNENTEFIPAASALQIATDARILKYIATFPETMLYLGEEYLFKYSSRFNSNSLRALTKYYKEKNHERGSNAFLLAYRKYNDKPVVQMLLISGLVELNGKKSIPDIRETYVSTQDTDLKRDCLSTLASFRDPDIKIEIELQLNSEKETPFERRVYINAYQSYLDGESWEGLAATYTKFKAKDTKETIASTLIFYSEKEAGTWEKIAKQEADPGLRGIISRRIQIYRDEVEELKNLGGG